MRLFEFQSTNGPRTLYVKRPVINGDAIRAWAKEQGFTSTLPTDDLHITIAYSKEKVDWSLGEWKEDDLTVEGGERRMEMLGQKAITLVLDDDRLHERWAFLVDEVGCSWDHPSYKQHITITYDATGINLKTVEPYRGPIELGPELHDEVNPNWNDDLKEEPLSEGLSQMLAASSRPLIEAIRGRA